MNHTFAGFADEAGTDLETQIRALQTLGWNAIEMRNVKVDGQTVHFDDVSDQTFETVANALQEAGIRIVGYGTQIANWSRKITSDFTKDVEELKRIVPRMHQTGTVLARVMSYPNDGWAATDWKKEAVRRLKELATIAEGNGIVLCHENCSGYGNVHAEAALELLHAVNSPAFKWVFDTGNFWETGYGSFDFYQAIKPHLIHVHIKDYVKDDRNEKGWAACFPGEGAGEVSRILHDLKNDYRGILTIEPHLAAVAHEARMAEGASAEALFVEYGRRFERLYATA